MKSGIILVNKPSKITSNSLVQQIKKKYFLHKIGHAGTLDPLASGLMIVLINEATKISEYLLNSNKEYYVEMKLFIKSISGDLDGEIIESKPLTKISEKTIIAVIHKFNNLTYWQKPPLYSAIKVNGKKLYEYARKKLPVSVAERQVTINSISFISYNEINQTISFQVSCSKGTYIRSLVEDIAAKLDTIAVTSKLIRIGSGNFTLNQAVSLDNINLDQMISIFDCIKINNLPLIEITNEWEKLIITGQKIKILNHVEKNVFLYQKNQVIAIYEHETDQVYRCKRLINSEEN